MKGKPCRFLFLVRFAQRNTAVGHRKALYACTCRKLSHKTKLRTTERAAHNTRTEWQQRHPVYPAPLAGAEKNGIRRPPDGGVPGTYFYTGGTAPEQMFGTRLYQLKQGTFDWRDNFQLYSAFCPVYLNLRGLEVYQSAMLCHKPFLYLGRQRERIIFT